MKGILLCRHGTRVQLGELAYEAFAVKFIAGPILLFTGVHIVSDITNMLHSLHEKYAL